MKNDPAFIYARLNPRDEWETQPSRSYDAKDLRREYRKMYYTEGAIKMIEEYGRT